MAMARAVSGTIGRGREQSCSGGSRWTGEGTASPANGSGQPPSAGAAAPLRGPVHPVTTTLITTASPLKADPISFLVFALPWLCCIAVGCINIRTPFCSSLSLCTRLYPLCLLPGSACPTLAPLVPLPVVPRIAPVPEPTALESSTPRRHERVSPAP